jgi:hypothetical protein
LKKTILLLIVLLFGTACSGDHKFKIFNNPTAQKIHKSSHCDAQRPFPQMILIPFFNRATQIVSRCSTYEKHKTSLAMIVFYQQWYEHFGDKNKAVRYMLEDVMIEWGDRKKIVKIAYDVEGNLIKEATVVGLARSGNYIWAWKGYNNKISETSLIHELVHQALRATNGTGDSDHEGRRYKGWTWKHTSMIIKTKNMLRTFNI